MQYTLVRIKLQLESEAIIQAIKQEKKKKYIYIYSEASQTNRDLWPHLKPKPLTKKKSTNPQNPVLLNNQYPLVGLWEQESHSNEATSNTHPNAL
jgi:hypothetical protein